MAECLFIKADEVVKMLGVSQSEGYRIIKKWNTEMAAKGYITMSDFNAFVDSQFAAVQAQIVVFRKSPNLIRYMVIVFATLPVPLQNMVYSTLGVHAMFLADTLCPIGEITANKYMQAIFPIRQNIVCASANDHTRTLIRHFLDVIGLISVDQIPHKHIILTSNIIYADSTSCNIKKYTCGRIFAFFFYGLFVQTASCGYSFDDLLVIKRPAVMMGRITLVTALPR